tara:strand:- start:894 stop:1691 length:798 start_codon:yes stop_codon:yes gene_type:complete
MAIKTIGKAALKAKRQAAKDAIKRSKKTMRFKEGAIIEKSKAIKNPKDTLEKFDKKLDRIEKLSRKKEVKIKNYAGFNPEQIQLSNAESNIFKEFKGIRNLVKGFGEGSKIKNVPQAKKFRKKLVKQAEGQKLKDKQTKEEAFKNVKVTKSKEKLKPKTKKVDRRLTTKELIEGIKKDKFRPKSNIKKENAAIDFASLQRKIKGKGPGQKPLKGGALASAQKELKEYERIMYSKKGGLIKRKAGGPCKPRGVGAAIKGFKMKGSK